MDFFCLNGWHFFDFRRWRAAGTEWVYVFLFGIYLWWVRSSNIAGYATLCK